VISWHFCHEIVAPNAIVECCVVWWQHTCLVGWSFGFRVPGEEAIVLVFGRSRLQDSARILTSLKFSWFSLIIPVPLDVTASSFCLFPISLFINHPEPLISSLNKSIIINIAERGFQNERNYYKLNNQNVRMAWDVDAAVIYDDYLILCCRRMGVPLFIVYVRAELPFNPGCPPWSLLVLSEQKEDDS
jgi:hypothetical protein